MSQRLENPRILPRHPEPVQGASPRSCIEPSCSRKRWQVCGRPGCLPGSSYRAWPMLKRSSGT